MAVAAIRRDIHAITSSSSSSSSASSHHHHHNHSEDLLLDELSSRFKGVLPIQPSPLMFPPDTNNSLKSTVLAGHLISCFVIGGECRLCFPQIISVVLQGVKAQEVNDLFTDLNINISVTTQSQLDILKITGVMPMTADSCGLITKSDAERLIAKLIPQTSGPLRVAVIRTDSVPVCHDCFGGCQGILIPSAPTDERIECNECKFMFTGEKFVSHTHSTKEIRRVCHWGFDSANWRYYLRLPEKLESDTRCSQILEQFKHPQQIRSNKRQADFKTNEIEAVPAKTMNLSGAPEILQKSHNNGIIESRRAPAPAPAPAPATQATLPVVSNPNTIFSNPIAAAAASLHPQIESLIALQIAASQLQTLPTNQQSAMLTALNASAFSLLSEQQKKVAAAASVAVSHQNDITTQNSKDVIVKPVAVRTERTEDATLIEKGAFNPRRTKTENTVPAASLGVSLDRLLEEHLSGTTLALARMLLAEERQTELRKREQLQNHNEQLRRENSLLHNALSSSAALHTLKGLTVATKAGI